MPEACIQEECLIEVTMAMEHQALQDESIAILGDVQAVRRPSATVANGPYGPLSTCQQILL